MGKNNNGRLLRWLSLTIILVMLISSCVPKYPIPQTGDETPPDGEATAPPSITEGETPDGEVPPLPIETTMPEVPAEPTSEPTQEIPTETPATPEEPTPEASPTLLPTEIITPEATQTLEKMPSQAWTLEIDLPISSGEIAAMGGIDQAQSSLENTLGDQLNSLGVDYEVSALSEKTSQAKLQVTIQGSGGIEEFRQVAYESLDPQYNLINGPAEIYINGEVQSGEEIPLMIESNPSTGYFWNVALADPNVIKVGNQDEFLEDDTPLLGAPIKQVIHLNARTNANTIVKLEYQRPWDKETPSSRAMIQVASLSDAVDLSSPTSPDGEGEPQAEMLAAESLSNDVYVEPPPLKETGEAVASAADAGEETIGLPESFDWRTYNKVPAVRNQGGCGSCWAFATVGAMEAAMMVQANSEAQNLSEQFLVSCNQSGWDCNGGWWAHDYHTSRLGTNQSEIGAVLEAALPYTATNGSCNVAFSHPYKLMQWNYLPYSAPTYIPSADAIKNAIYSYGPVAVAVTVGSAFSSYKGGIFTTNIDSAVNHGVVLVGWGTDPTYGDYWIMRNSWGTGWGENGYMRIKVGVSRIGYKASYVTYNPPPPPEHDDFNAPKIIPADSGTVTYSNEVDITSATSAVDDPTFPNLSKFYKTVWYKFTPASNGSLSINTTGSAYDTVLGIWQGNRGSLSLVAMNDDSNGTTQSSLSNIQLTGGQTYFFEVASYYLTGGGQLRLQANFTPPCYVLNGIVTPSGSGTVSVLPLPNCGASNYLQGTQVNLTATAAQGFAFASWSGDVSGTATSTSVTMNSNKSVTANFLDILPPRVNEVKLVVSNVATALADGAVTSASFSQMDITFNEPVQNTGGGSGAHDASNPANYSLTHLGGDDALGGGDDQAIAINSIVYTEGSRTARLNLNNGAALPLGKYIVRVSGTTSIKDLAGNSLDGNSDGIGGDDFTRNFIVSVPPGRPTLINPLPNANVAVGAPSFEWNTATDTVSYQVQIDDAVDFVSPVYEATYPATQTSFTLPAEYTLGEGKFFWRVRAMNRYEQSGSWSSIWYFFIDNQAPLPPVLYRPTTNSTARNIPTYSWKASSGSVSYQFRYTSVEDVNFNTPVYTSVEIASTSHKPTDQTWGAYLWQVRARDAAGNWSDWSGPFQVQINPPLPVKVTLLSPANNSSSNADLISLNWNVANNAEAYQLQVDDDSRFGSPMIDEIIETNTRFYENPESGKYFWRVRSMNTAGEFSAWSSAWYFFIDRDAPLPPVLYRPADNSTASGIPLFSWRSSVTARSYQFRITASEDINFSEPVHTSEPTTRLSYSPPVQETGVYIWQVRAADAALNWSDWSTPCTVTITAPLPARPLALVPANKSYHNTAEINFSWNGVAFAEQYQIHVSRNARFTSIEFDATVDEPSAFASFAVEGVYYWRVRASNVDGKFGGWSKTSSFTLDQTEPGSPLTTSPASANTVRGAPTFTWKTVSGAKYYQVRYTTSTDSAFAAPLFTSNSLTAARFKPAVMQTGDFLWQVRAGDLAGNWSNWSAPFALTVQAALPQKPALSTPYNRGYINDNSPTFAWSEVAYGESYQVQVSQNAKFVSLAMDEIHAEGMINAGEAEEFPDGKYYWRVRAFNENEEAGAWSSGNYFTIDTQPPAAPVMISPTNEQIIMGSPLYKWKMGTGMVVYQMRYTSIYDTGFASPLYTSPEIRVTSHKPAVQQPGVYLWQVRARDLAGNWSDWSSARIVIVTTK